MKLDLKIETRDQLDYRGGFFCHFSYGKKKYYASLSRPEGTFTECMIFKDGKWDELYCNRCVPFTKDAFVACIEEFVKSLDE